MAELSHEPSIDLPLRCWVEIDLSAIRHNARMAQAMSGAREPAVLAIIKADAYGHGAVAVGRALQEEPCVFALGVANVREGIELRAGNVDLPIYILGPALPAERDTLVAQGFVAAISTIEEAEHYSAIAKTHRCVAKVQLVIDTGMGRIGVLPYETPALAKSIIDLPALELDSVSSHLPSADEDEVFTKSQIAQYREIVTSLKNAGITMSHSHIANSAGAMGYAAASGESVRAGLMLFGCSPLPSFQHRLKPALTWKACITLVRDLPVGQSINYGRTFITRCPTIAATVSVGYADGYLRHLSGKGTTVLIGGVRCPLLGRVTMDQIVVDVTDLSQRPVPGMEVVLLGSQGENTALSAVELAEKAETIPWEILTSISKRVTRVPLSQ